MSVRPSRQLIALKATDFEPAREVCTRSEDHGARAWHDTVSQFAARVEGAADVKWDHGFQVRAAEKKCNARRRLGDIVRRSQDLGTAETTLKFTTGSLLNYVKTRGLRWMPQVEEI